MCNPALLFHGHMFLCVHSFFDKSLPSICGVNGLDTSMGATGSIHCEFSKPFNVHAGHIALDCSVVNVLEVDTFMGLDTLGMQLFSIAL